MTRAMKCKHCGKRIVLAPDWVKDNARDLGFTPPEVSTQVDPRSADLLLQGQHENADEGDPAVILEPLTTYNQPQDQVPDSLKGWEK